MRYKRTVLFVIVILFAFIFLLPQLVVQPVLQRSLESFVQEEFAASQVIVENSWGWDVLFGRAKDVQIRIGDGEIGGLMVDTLYLEGHDVRFDAWALFSEQKFRYFGSEILRIEARVSEGALNEYFQQEIAVVDDLDLHFIEDIVVLQGNIEMWNLPLSVKLEGDLVIADQTVLRLVPLHVTVEEAAIPPVMLGAVNDFFTIGINFDVLPFPVEITDVEIGDSTVMIRVQEVAK